MNEPGGSGTTAIRAAGAPAVPRRRIRLNVAHDSWELVWSHVHRVLTVNLGLAVTSAPLLGALQLCHQPWRYPVLFGLLGLGIGPSLAGAFGYLHRADADERAPVRAFCHAYRRHFGRALLRWTPCLLLALVAAADVAELRRHALGPLLAPLDAVVVLVALCTGVVALVDLASGGARSARHALPAAAYAVVRRWPLALMNLVLLAVALAAVNQAPLLGLAVLPGCVLFVVWRNGRTMLTAAASRRAVSAGG